MPIASRTFRVFVSSTFEDLIEERNALQRDVFPHLSKLCEAHGARFQAIDLRWGVRDEAVLGQRMMEICLAEIERCQRTGIKPNFIVLLGDRYGRPPLPARIQALELEAVLGRVRTDQDRALVEGWYQRDDNAVPSEYLLKPRTGEFVDANRWMEVEQPLQQALLQAAHAAGLDRDALLKYEGSASHQEIVKGLGTTPEDRRHVFAFFRTKDKADEPPELRDLKKFLREQLGEGVFKYDAGDVAKLCRNVAENLEKVILDEASRFESRSALDLEIEAHALFARDRSRNFVGRKPVLDAITEHLKSDDRWPVVIHGVSGSGKSAIIARTSALAAEDAPNAVIIRRFIGATPDSSNGLTLLRSLCQEMTRRYGRSQDVPATFNEIVIAFSDRIKMATPDRPLILCVDALDQLGAQDPAAAMNWLPAELPPNCKVVVSTMEVPGALQRARLVHVAPFPVEEAARALELCLDDAHRMLQPEQHKTLLESFRRCPVPLYLKLAFEEGCRWRSFDPVDRCVLGEGLEGIVGALFRRLSEESNHGPVLVGHALGYLTAARYGLTENEILAVLSDDAEVWKDFSSRARHEPPERLLPLIVWSRLHLDLEPYLTERAAPGGRVLYFYHRQIGEAAERVYLSVSKEARHVGLARYFGNEQLWLKPFSMANDRKVFELPYQQARGHLFSSFRATLTDLQFIEAKCASGMTPDLLTDYTLQQPPDPVVADFARFVRANSHVFNRRPALVHQQAANEPGATAPAEAARIRNEAKRGSRMWLRLINKREHITACDMTIDGHRHTVTQAAFSPAGTLLVSASGAWGQPGELKIWDATSGDELATLIRNPKGVTSCAFSVDGKRILAGLWDGSLRIWDVDSRSEIGALVGHTDRVETCAFSPDGTLVVSGSLDGTVRVWDSERRVSIVSARLARSGRIPSGASVHRCTFSQDGRNIVARCGRRIVVLKSETLGEVGRLTNPGGWSRSGAITSFALLRDGTRILTGDADGAVKLWDLRTPNAPVVLARERTRLLDLSRARDENTGDALLEPHGSNEVAEIALSPDERLVVFGGRELRDAQFGEIRSPGVLQLWDLTTRLEVSAVAAHVRGVTTCVFSPDGKKILTGSEDGTLKIWDVSRLQDSKLSNEHADAVSSVSFWPIGRRVMTGSFDGSVKMWDTTSGTWLGDLRSGGTAVRDCTCSPTSDEAFWASSSMKGDKRVWWHRSDTVSIYAYQDRVLISEIPANRGSRARDMLKHMLRVGLQFFTLSLIVGIFLMLTSTIILRAPSVRPILQLISILTAAGLVFSFLLNLGRRITCVAVAPDGRAIAIGCGQLESHGFGQGELKVASVRPPYSVIGAPGHPRDVTDICFSPDGKHILTASEDGSLKIWKQPSLELVRTLRNRTHVLSLKAFGIGRRIALLPFLLVPALREYRSEVLACAFSPDGVHIASASSDRTLKVWDCSSGHLVFVMAGHAGEINSCAFSPDGRWIITGARDGNVIVSDRFNGAEACRFPDALDVRSVAWSSDGCFCAAGDRSGRLFLFEIMNQPNAPLILTAWRSDLEGDFAFGCPACLVWSRIDPSDLRVELKCTGCGRAAKLNPFTISGDWRAVANKWKLWATN